MQGAKEELARNFAARLAGGHADRAILESVGAGDPVTVAADFEAALERPELAATVELWAPTLLASARPGYGARCLTELPSEWLDLRKRPALPLLLGSSNALARQLLRHPEWASELDGEPPGAPSEEPAPDWDSIRAVKYRGLLRIAARDLLGRSFDESLAELSDLADRCLRAALDCAVAERRGEPPAVFALGKHGGRELNFSSDLDLLFVYESEPGEADFVRNEEVSRLVRHLKRCLEGPTGEGFVYRIDLDLRPEGRSGPAANSVQSALAYYESFGAEWERQMLIRLRPVAGDGAAARAFQEGIQPFVYRRSIDPRVLDEVRAMKLRIESERRAAGRNLETELKEGPGGIRDVEFLVQALQLFHGGSRPELRTGNVLDALSVLGELGILPEATVEELAEAYRWLRRAEHGVQMVEERQTHRFPLDPAEQLGLARRLGYRALDGRVARDELLDDWTISRANVRRHFGALVLGEPR